MAEDVLSSVGSPVNEQTVSWLASGGKMGARIAAFAWHEHPLGPIASWPQSLKIAVRIMLTSRYAMWMGWGPEFYFFCNDAYLPTVGLKEKWVLGASARRVWAEIWPDIGPRAEVVVATGAATWDESLLLFLQRSGYAEETYHTFSYSPISDDDGSTGGMLCVVTEETERVIGERRLRLLRELAADLTKTSAENELFDAVRHQLEVHSKDLPFVLIYLFEPDGKSVRLACAQGTQPGALIAPPLIELGSAAAVWPAQEILQRGRAITLNHLAQHFAALPTGPWNKPARQAVVVPIAQQGQEQPAGFLVAGVNPFRPLDNAYRGFISLLAGQIGSALANARAYEAERQRAEALTEIDRAKTAFFSNVSHEFRTPLTLMLGPLEDALAESAAQPGPERERLQLVYRNGLRLLRLVNTLLDFSRSEAGRLRAVYQPTDLAALTADLASGFRSAIERAGLTLRVDCPPLAEPVYVDHTMWEKIVLNLLSNAFKFTFTGSIEVALNAVGETVELTVRDTGIGIAEAELPRLFERFHRVEGARGRTFEGSGIGLALVQELVRLHGGSVQVTSTIGSGTIFTVALPLGTAHLPAAHISQQPAAATVQTNAAAFVEEALRWLPADELVAEAASEHSSSVEVVTPAPAAHGPRILLADDNADMRAYVQRLLADKYVVETVADGQAALEAVRAHPPELVLSDVMMPRLDGFGLLRELRRDERTATIPVILLSARAGEEARVEGLEAGADDYLTKPFSARELLARVRTNIDLARMRRTVEAERQKTFAILESSVDAFYALDAEFCFTYLNRHAEDYFDLRREALLGRNIWEALPALRQSVYQTAYEQAVRERTPIKFEVYSAVSQRWVDVRAYPSADWLLVNFRDITERKRHEMNLALLAEISQDLARLTTVGEIMEVCSTKLAAFLQLSACILFEIDEVADEGITSHVWQRAGLPSYAGKYRLGQFLAADFQRTMRAGESFVVCDTATDPRTAAEAYAALKIGAFVAVPLLHDGQWRFLLVIYDTVARDWRSDEIELLRELTVRIWMRLQRAQAEEKLRESEERFRYIADAAPVLIWMCDNSKKCTWFNKPWLTFTGRTLEQESGDGWSAGLHPTDLSNCLTVFHAACEARQPFSLEYRLRRHDGTYRWMLDNGIPRFAPDGSFLGYIGSCMDINEHKQMEQALREADVRKDEFLAMLAHELRNPLAPIRNAAQVLKLVGVSDPNQQWAREVIERQTQHLTRLVDDLLDVSRITRGKVTLQRETLELATVLNRAVETSRPLIDARKHTLAVTLPSTPIQVIGDLTRLVQVVSNLLTNAAKYTDEGGRLHLSATQRAGEAIISVRDNGMGLSADLLPHVFDLFTQAERALDRSQGGLGIGLTLARNLVELHGGKIEARSAGTGQGSEFIVRLPVLRAAAPATTAPADGVQQARPRGLRILVVEDNVDAAEMLHLMLKLAGHEARIALDGATALATAQSFMPQVILCDIGLPGMNGYEIALQLRSQPAFKQTRLIALSGYGQEEDRRHSKAVGFDYHLSKPIEPDALMALLGSLR